MDVEAVVVDLDGTIYRGDEAIPGAAEAVEAVRKLGYSVLFVTNNPTRSPTQYAERLNGFGISAEPEEILPAGTVTAEYLAMNHYTDDIFMIGSAGLREQFQAAGIDPVDEPRGADVVVTSHTYGFDYEDLTAGLWALDDASAFYGTDPDLVYPDAEGTRYPGSGAITGAVATVAEREPDLVLGKPSQVMVEHATERLECHPSACLIVGDGIDTDIAFGKQAGMETVLVLSGRTTRTELENGVPRPDHVVESIADLPGLL
ncbi:MAG: HAD-IIA family hydrolase [Salinirussus sp.]